MAAMATRPLATMAGVLAGADDAPALLCGSGGPTYSRAQLRSLAVRFAASLRASGVQPGDVVTIAEPNTVRGGEARRREERRRDSCERSCSCVSIDQSLVNVRLRFWRTPNWCKLSLPLPHNAGGVRGGLRRHHARPRRGRAAQPKLQDGERRAMLRAACKLLTGCAD